jgi:hypothetical protein
VTGSTESTNNLLHLCPGLASGLFYALNNGVEGFACFDSLRPRRKAVDAMKAPGGARVALDFCGITGLLTASRRISDLPHPGLVASPRSSGNFCHPGLVGTLATWDLIPGLVANVLTDASPV